MPKDPPVMDDVMDEVTAPQAEAENARSSGHAGDSPGPDPLISASPPGPDPQRLAPGIEAILLTADKPVPAARLAEALLGLAPPATSPAPAPEPAHRDNSDDSSPGESAPDESSADPRPRRRRTRKGAEPAAADPGPAAAIVSAIASLNDVYAQTGRAFRIEQVAGGYRLMTLPDFAQVIAAFHKSRTSSRLSRAAVETLAIIAYRQPLTRAHLEAIRGVGCGEVLRSLMERKLITIKGRAEELGRPILYGTTREFLDAFGLASLKDLPSASELQVG